MADRTEPAQPTEQTRPPRRERAVAPADFPETFAEMFPGDIAELSQKEPADPVVDFRWNGFAIRVGFGPTPVGGVLDPTSTPMERCLDLSPTRQRRESCVPGPDGSVIRTVHATGPAADGGVTVSGAMVFNADGLDVTVSAANAADTKDSPILAGDAPFTPAQLLRVAQSDIWFKQP